MKIQNFLTGAAALATLTALQPLAFAAPFSPIFTFEDQATTASYQKGTPAFLFKVSGGPTDDLAKIDKAIETTDQVLELSVGEELVMAIDLKNDLPTILFSKFDFKPEKIAYVREEKDQAHQAIVTFSMKECVAPAESKAVAVEASKDKAQDQTKAETCSLKDLALKLEPVQPAKEETKSQEQPKQDVSPKAQQKG